MSPSRGRIFQLEAVSVSVDEKWPGHLQSGPTPRGRAATTVPMGAAAAASTLTLTPRIIAVPNVAIWCVTTMVKGEDDKYT